MKRAQLLQKISRQICEVSAVPNKELSAPADKGALIATLEQDYSSSLRRLFDRQQAREIFSEISSALPALNREVIGELDPRRFAQLAAELGAQCVTTPFATPRQSGLRGFYVRRGEGLKHPLICVNTATHPVVTASSFWHEFGHHLTARLFDDSRRELKLSYSTNYHLHLHDPLEAAADMVSILAAYPKAVATRLFARSLSTGRAPDVDVLLAKLEPYLRSVSGFKLEGRFRRTENLRYLAAMIHFGRLRWALLSEFEI